MIYSYDVFDTLLVRTCLYSIDLFDGLGLLLGMENLVEDPQGFRDNRIAAEQRARTMSSREEVTFAEISRELARVYRWSDAQSARAAALEIELELACLRPIGAMVEEVNRRLDSGETVCFASDMYLPQDVIERALCAAGVRPGYTLFLSSTVLKTKHHASLYRVIAEHYNVRFEDIAHTGDNRFSDRQVPRRLGIDARWFQDSLPNRYELGVHALTEASRHVRGLLAGSMKSARLRKKFESAHAHTLWRTGADVVGPVLCMYVLWVLQSAKASDIQRLYFVARDGQILLAMAEILQRNCPEFQGIECRYLYGSRQAWHLPSVVRIGPEELNWIFDDTFFLSVRSVCKRVDIAPEQIAEPLAGAGFAQDGWEENLGAIQRQVLSTLFRDNPAVHALIMQSASDKRALLMGYLKQERFFDAKQVGIVDIGWRGRLQASLSKSIAAWMSASEDPPEVNGFYWGLFPDAAQRPENGKFSAFMKEPTLQRATDYLTDYAAILEVFVAASHGSCIGYAQEGDVYKPLLREQVNVEMMTWGLATQQQASLRFCDDFSASMGSALAAVDEATERAVNASVFSRFCRTPDRSEADAYGSVRMYEDQTENVAYELAPVATRDRPVIAHNHNIWQEGCKARNRFPLYQLYRASYYAQRLRRRLSKSLGRR